MIETILNSVPCGYLSFGDDGTILVANQTLLDLLGRKEFDLKDKHVEGIFTVAGRIFYQTHFFPLLKMAGQVEEIYLSLRASSGAEVPVLINAVRVERDGVMVNDCIIVAMRRRNQYEDEILKAKRDLETANRAKDQVNSELELTKLALERKQRELQERNCELESLKDRLEEQVQERTAELRTSMADMQAFSYAIAHDLRAPLRAIVSTSEILREEAADKLDGEHFYLLGRQSLNGRKLSTLVDDLLRFAGLGRERTQRHPINLTQTAMDVIAEAGTPYQLAKMNFSVQPGMRASGDPALVRIVLENLIGNAVKYSPAGGEIRVGQSLQAGQATYFVRDQGIGLDMSYAQKIFGAFERLHLESEFEGNGIGLALVKRIVERHGGAVWVESQPQMGATFYFTLGESGPIFSGEKA